MGGGRYNSYVRRSLIQMALGLALLCCPRWACADTFLRFHQTDKQAHAMVAFQATLLLERYFDHRKFARVDAVMASTLTMGLITLAKEKLIDRAYDPYDVWASLFGSVVGSGLFLALPHNFYVMEVEGGLLRYSTASADLQSAAPPSSVLIKAQTTIWFAKRIGLHFFSGGMDNGRPDDSGKRLHYGAGLRANLISFGRAKGEAFAPLSIWAGTDYGRLLFATESRVVAYPRWADAWFYSAGLRYHTGSSAELALETQLVPYKGHKLLGIGAALGFTL